MVRFEVGQRVVCVNNGRISNRGRWRPGCIPKLRGIYTIRRVFVTHTSEVAVCLEEIQNTGFGETRCRGYRACRFRPVDESRLDVFRTMLKPIKECENA